MSIFVLQSALPKRSILTHLSVSMGRTRGQRSRLRHQTLSAGEMIIEPVRAKDTTRTPYTKALFGMIRFTSGDTTSSAQATTSTRRNK